MTLSKNCGFCAAAGVFIPIGRRCGPETCAENIAASPNTAMRPRPRVNVAPCHKPSASTRGVASLNFQASLGKSSTVPGARTSRGVAGPITRKASPVNVLTESIRSRAPRPRVIGWSPRFCQTAEIGTHRHRRLRLSHSHWSRERRMPRPSQRSRPQTACDRDEKQRATVAYPLPERVDFFRGKRRRGWQRPVAILVPVRCCICDNQDLCRRQCCAAEPTSKWLDDETISPKDLHERCIPPVNGVKVVVSFIK